VVALRFIADLIEPLRVARGSMVKLSRDHDPGYIGQVTRPQATALLADGVKLLAKYQDRLAAQDTFGVLLVLQGLDASGKDSTIKHTMSCVNPQAVAVRAFKQPSAEELNHDFLWRYQCALPGRGRIGIFNRSHYEEVLVVRVHQDLLAAQRLPAAATKGDVWDRRSREINDWERYLRVPRRLRHPGRRGSGVRRPAQLTDLVMWAVCLPGEHGLRGSKWDRGGGPWRAERS
jgi:polyphosphate kinase 2 (PPK2 family)